MKYSRQQRKILSFAVLILMTPADLGISAEMRYSGIENPIYYGPQQKTATDAQIIPVQLEQPVEPEARPVVIQPVSLPQLRLETLPDLPDDPSTPPSPSPYSVPTAPPLLAASETAGVLHTSNLAPAISAQRRNPIAFDPHVRGFRYKQILAQADWQMWDPVRLDLDTMLNKFDPGLIDNVVVIPGPYGVRYGPRFAFIDVQSIRSPRYDCGFESHGRIGFDMRANGGQLYGRATALGGNTNWGFIANYGNRTGSDYKSGDNTLIPSSYSAQNFLGQVGFDLGPHSSVEFRYHRLDQTDSEYYLQFFDIDFLGTDAFSVNYVNENPEALYRRLRVDAWYNRTRYNGDNLNASKTSVRERVANALAARLNTETTYFRGDTNGDRSHTGARVVATFGEDDWVQLHAGGDMRYTDQQILERFAYDGNSDPYNSEFTLSTNLPRSWLVDPGAFVEITLPLKSWWDASLGGRVDFVRADARNEDLTSIDGNRLRQENTLYAFYLTNDFDLSENLQTRIGFGHAQRPAGLLERYADFVFVGVLQSGFSRVIGGTQPGEPLLRPERLWQIDWSMYADYENFRGRASVFHSWVFDFITYKGNRILDPTGARQLFYTNTDLATMHGFEVYGEADLSAHLTGFAQMHYFRGIDQEIDADLWAMYPFESRLGLRLHDAEGGRIWGLELAARLVADQNRVGLLRPVTNDGLSLIAMEDPTPAFQTVALRGYYNTSDNLSLTMGIDNLFDRNYLEHYDLRLPADGDFDPEFAYAPGFTFYAGLEYSR